MSAGLEHPERVRAIVSREARRVGLTMAPLGDCADRCRRAVRARHAAAYRLYMELQMPARRIARALGYADRTSAENAILRGAALAGHAASRLCELREGTSSRIDWCKLAYAVAGWREAQGLTQQRAARRAGISRAALVHAEQGARLEAETFVPPRAAMGRDPRDFLKSDKRELAGEQILSVPSCCAEPKHSGPLSDTHETSGEQRDPEGLGRGPDQLCFAQREGTER